jgi:hypothetical protein
MFCLVVDCICLCSYVVVWCGKSVYVFRLWDVA